MRTLLLLRHARASPSLAGGSDFDRPLADEGRKAAARIGQFLKHEKLRVDLALTSPAVRARETTDAFLQAAGVSVTVRADERLYEGGPLRVLEVLAEVDDNLKAVLVVGHNPVFEQLVELLTGESVHLSPGTLTLLEANAESWEQIGEGKHELRRVVRPKELLAG